MSKMEQKACLTCSASLLCFSGNMRILRGKFDGNGQTISVDIFTNDSGMTLAFTFDEVQCSKCPKIRAMDSKSPPSKVPWIERIRE